MEIVLQWLDDLEDLMFTVPLCWERLRWRCLQIGLGASMTLMTGLAQLSVGLAWAFASIAACSVSVWFVGILGAGLLRLRPAHA